MTPRVGGVGTTTVAMLFRNAVELAERQIRNTVELAERQIRNTVELAERRTTDGTGD
ncbi:hypothetical protein [Plantactinospora endophytica]|uniref:hypothetical protein n=1 Tax=Plantactinospora endophytica TaxID=673535 RepID=UPI003641F83F